MLHHLMLPLIRGQGSPADLWAIAVIRALHISQEDPSTSTKDFSVGSSQACHL